MSNSVVNRLLEKATPKLAIPKESPIKQLENTLLLGQNWSVNEIDHLVGTLMDKKRKLEANEREVEAEVLVEFLRLAKSQKEENISKLSGEITRLDEDIERAEHFRKLFNRDTPSSQVPVVEGSTRKRTLDDAQLDDHAETPDSSLSSPTPTGFDSMKLLNDPLLTLTSPNSATVESLAAKKRRVLSHFDDLQQCYFDVRKRTSLCFIERLGLRRH